MENLNLPPFYVGQKVVALRSAYNWFGVGIKKGQTYQVTDIYKCSCGQYNVAIGLPINVSTDGATLSDCTGCEIKAPRAQAWVPSEWLAPIQE